MNYKAVIRNGVRFLAVGDSETLDEVDRCGIGAIWATESDPMEPGYDDFTPACIIHDYEYQKHANGEQDKTRQEVDAIFFDAMSMLSNASFEAESVRRKMFRQQLDENEITSFKFYREVIKSYGRILRRGAKKWIYYGIARVFGAIPWFLHGEKER